MKPIKKSFLPKLAAVFLFAAGLAVLAFAGIFFWARQPLIQPNAAAIKFSVAPNSGLLAVAQQIEHAGIRLQPWLFSALARLSGKHSRLKAGSYELKPGTTPLRLIDQLARGEFAQESVAIIEGWTFRQMRQALDQHPALRHDAANQTDQALLAKLGLEFAQAEGLFFPDTYRFGAGSSDLLIYRQAHAQLTRKLNALWNARDPTLPYKNSYDGLIMASLIEKETGQADERAMIAAVFVNRLKRGMLLQTDPTVIYGMGAQYQGVIRKRDLLTDTPYNTYTRAGLPPTPIALVGAAALNAAFNPASSDALYFVARNDGTSEFSNNLQQHVRAVNRYQRP